MEWSYLFSQLVKVLIKISFLQTPRGLLVIDVDYKEVLFNEKLKIVQKNYFGQYLVEFFEKRVPRRLPPFDLSNEDMSIKATPKKTTPIKATPSKATTMPSKATSASSSKAKPRPTRFSLNDEEIDLFKISW